MSLHPMELGYDDELCSGGYVSDHGQALEFDTHLGDGDTSDERLEIIVPSERFNEIADFEALLSAIAGSPEPVDESFCHYADEYKRLIDAGKMTVEELIQYHQDRFDASQSEQFTALLSDQSETIRA